MRLFSPTWLVLSLLTVAAATAQPAKCYDWILRDKLRGGYLGSGNRSEALAEAKAAGINALMPKFGGLHAPPTDDDVALLRAWGELGRKYGAHILPVFNFRGGSGEEPLSDRREVTAAGETMKLTPCPLDGSFWEKYLRGRAVWLAQHAREVGIDGGLIDPEMYGSDHTSYSSVCYCADCLREFGRDTGRAVPELAPAQRAGWLKAQGLAAAFEQHFQDKVKGFAQQIERDCHAANPDFLLGTLHPDVAGPFTRGLVMGLGTPTHPLLGFSEMTYSSGYTAYVDQQQQAFAAMPAHVLFIPGLWQQQFPSENLAEQYYACAAHSAGYWVYTFESLLADVSKSPGYSLREPNERYWAAMRTADTELDKLVASGGTYVSALKVRPFDPPLPVLSYGDLKVEALQPSPDPQPHSAGPITVPRLRGRAALFVLAKAGEPVVGRVTNVQLARYLPGTQWVVAGPDGKQVAEGHLKVRESGELRFTPERDGVYLVVVASGNNSHSVELTSGQPNAFLASAKQPFHVNGQFGRVYFHVPQGVTAFKLSVKAEGQAAGRGGKLTLTGPDGQTAAHLEGDLGSRAELAVTVPAGQAGRVWCLAAEDVSNDLTVSFSSEIPPYVSTDPAKVLTTRP